MTAEERKIKCLEIALNCAGFTFDGKMTPEELIEAARKILIWVNK